MEGKEREKLRKERWKDRQTLFYRTLLATIRGPIKSVQMGIEIIKSLFPKLRTYQNSIYPVINQKAYNLPEVSVS